MTPEGLEANFATNTLAPFALTELLLPLLAKASPPARVIAVSSGGQYTEALVTEDLQWEKEGGFDGARQYARDKRRQTALTERWAADHPQTLFFTMHPGWAGASLRCVADQCAWLSAAWLRRHGRCAHQPAAVLRAWPPVSGCLRVLTDSALHRRR